jgi:DeoR/GlpR family transcriptional regulator of sugar metabolism
VAEESRTFAHRTNAALRTGGAVLPAERRRLIAARLRANGSVSVADLETEYGISAMTARRDLAQLERQGVAQRTHGGAVLPGLSIDEDSFFQRVEVAVDAKERLAAAAVELLAPGEAVFLDSSTTAYFAARVILRANLPCTLLTNAAPIVELVCDADASRVDLIAMGGSLRRLTRSFVGPRAVLDVEAHFADHALFSVKGVTRAGDLTDPDPLEAEVKRTMIRRSRQPVLLIDGSKVDRSALSVIGSASELSGILAADVDRDVVARLAHAGIDVRPVCARPAAGGRTTAERFVRHVA